MAGQIPHNQLAGIPLTVFLAPVGEAVPAVDVTPAGNWAVFGPTTGDQTWAFEGGVETFMDNDSEGPVKAVRPEEFIRGTFTVVNATLEALAQHLNASGDVVSATGPPAISTLPLIRGRHPTEYAGLFKGLLASPYGAFPAQLVIPRFIFESEPELVFSKEGRVEHECVALALMDPGTATANQKMGFLVAQTA